MPLSSTATRHRMGLLVRLAGTSSRDLAPLPDGRPLWAKRTAVTVLGNCLAIDLRGDQLLVLRRSAHLEESWVRVEHALTRETRRTWAREGFEVAGPSLALEGVDTRRASVAVAPSSWLCRCPSCGVSMRVQRPTP